MTRVFKLTVTLFVVTGALLGGGCDIIYHSPPVTAADRTGIFVGITTTDETNDQSCSSFLKDDPPLFIFDFENFDKTGPGYDVTFNAAAPAANTLSAQQIQVSITNPDDSECPFETLGEIAFEFSTPAPAPGASGQSNEDYTPVVIHNVVVPAATPCSGPPLCANPSCMDPIEESRLVDVRTFCFTQ